MAEVSAREVRAALFAQSVKKAPGVDGIGFKTLRLLWQWAANQIVSLVQGCISAGYHPCTWRTAKGVLLRKQGKPTYIAAKAYHIISLLNCLDKVVGKAIATWIASFYEKKNSFHTGQFGCRRGRGTSDAVAQLVAKVERTWAAKRTALASLPDIKGAFARYLQLKSGYAVTGAHLRRIGKVEDARCWWCDDSDHTVAHLLLRCRKWRRQRDCMMRGMRARKIPISAMRDE